MGFWDVDYDKLVWQNLPVLLRTPVRYAWQKALVAPSKYIYGLFTTFKNNTLYRLANNGQVCYLQKVLNDTFDPVDRGITISDTAITQPVWLAVDDEDAPVWLAVDSETAPVWMPTDSEIFNFAIQFIVNVPERVLSISNYSETWLRAVVNEYRLPSKGNFSVVYF